MARVTLKDIRKEFGTHPAIKGVSLSIDNGELFSLLGPSGCGKTTLLRMIAGLTYPTSGSIFFDDADVSIIPPNRRNIGMVFQNYALFPHMTVFENVEFGLRTRRIPKSGISNRVAEALKLVGLSGLEKRPVPQLSGGQQQRVALARAIVIQPSLLLLDEPLSNLDAQLREETRAQIRALQKKLGITTIYVTHDQEEALAMSDRIAVLRDGVCEQLGAPGEIFRRPVNGFVARFMGKMNIWKGTLARREGRTFFVHPSGLTIRLPEGTEMREGEIRIGLRPHAVQLTPEPPGNSPRGIVKECQFKGASVEYLVESGPVEIVASQNVGDSGIPLATGIEVGLELDGDRAVLLPDRE